MHGFSSTKTRNIQVVIIGLLIYTNKGFSAFKKWGLHIRDFKTLRFMKLVLSKNVAVLYSYCCCNYYLTVANKNRGDLKALYKIILKKSNEKRQQNLECAEVT